MYVCVCVYVNVYVCLCVCVYVSVYVCVSLSLSQYLGGTSVHGSSIRGVSVSVCWGSEIDRHTQSGKTTYPPPSLSTRGSPESALAT